MSQRRAVPYRFYEKGRCRWCGKPPKPPRQTWCSQACVDEYLILSDPGFVRAKLAKRDHGICADCGLDCVAFVDALSGWARMANRHPTKTVANLYDRWWFLSRTMLEYLREAGLLRFLHRTAWEADHIIPVSEGGGGCGLDNYRTLCWRCHAVQTAMLARRKANERRKQTVLY